MVLDPRDSALDLRAGVVLLVVGLAAGAVVLLLLVRRRARAGIAAVVITAGILVAGTGAGVATALAPCTFPAVAESGLETGDGQSAPAGQAPTGSLRATDGVRLAYSAFVPAHPIASLVFYHGSGANSAAGYLPMARELEADGIATYLVDIRGHGASGGPRGDAPSTTQLYQDVETAVAFVHAAQPGVKEFVGGHSAGAGLVLNAVPLIHRQVAGYVFIAPDFGLHSGTELETDASNFATVCERPLVATAVTNGILAAHTPAVGFAYTRQQVVQAGLVDRYTATMAIGQNPDDAAGTLAGIEQPVGVWVGAKDEMFDAAKVLAYAHHAPHVTAARIPGDSHLGVLDDAASRVGPWVEGLVG